MNGKQLAETLGLKTICGELESFDGVYAGDLLSRAMSHVEADNLWITIMNNMNVIAVAALLDFAWMQLHQGMHPRELLLYVYSETDGTASAYSRCIRPHWFHP